MRCIAVAIDLSDIVAVVVGERLAQAGRAVGERFGGEPIGGVEGVRRRAAILRYRAL